jgi:hypothetical protein
MKTAVWFVVWLAVWYYNRIFTFIYSYFAYLIIRQRLGPERREALQESHDRVNDGESTPNTFGEMIGQHGSSNWLDPMLEYVGPIIQPQIKDLADWMEVLVNFYEWKTPRATISMLLLIGAAILLATFGSTDFNMRLSTLGIILMFFLDRPLARRYPNYPQLIAPLHWIFWDIPTHSEISFRHLRREAEDIKRNSVPQNSTKPVELPSKLEHVAGGFDSVNSIEYAEKSPNGSSLPLRIHLDIFATHCNWHASPGNIIISLTDVRFVRSFPKKEMWRRQFNELIAIKKGNGQTSIMKNNENFLEFEFTDGTSEKLESLKKKDELFNIIIAFSGLTWQQVQL